jgi:hypothetical protein
VSRGLIKTEAFFVKKNLFDHVQDLMASDLDCFVSTFLVFLLKTGEALKSFNTKKEEKKFHGLPRVTVTVTVTDDLSK